jgi:hypothetical protein
MSDAIQFYIIPAVLYALVASPGMYQATRGVFGPWVASGEGTARIGGLILHAIVFILLATLAMRYFPGKRSTFAHVGGINQQEGMNTKIVESHLKIDAAPYEA